MSRIVLDVHDCDDVMRYDMKWGQPARGSVWECDCGSRWIRGKWLGGWRALRWFDRVTIDEADD